jgi:hypothetical protein
LVNQFNTTRLSRKFGELSADGRCTMTYIDVANLSCITFAGEAERLPARDEAALRASWPLLPPLSILYAGGDGLADFTGWRLRPTRVQLVSLPAALGGGPRADWAPPEIERSSVGGDPWRLRCKGGMQGL